MTRAVVVLGAVLVGGQVARGLPHDQTFVFPVGSVFPNATHFGASWKRSNETEPLGGVTLTFSAPPPLMVRQHASLPNGEYVLTLTIEVPETPRNTSLIADHAGVQTNIERRVTLSGGETMIALAAGGF